MLKQIQVYSSLWCLSPSCTLGSWRTPQC